MTETDSDFVDRAQLILGGLTLLLAITAVGFLIANASLQRTAGEGQTKIASAQAAANVNSSLIRLIAKSATEDDDPALKALLAENGITVNETKAPTTASSPAK